MKKPPSSSQTTKPIPQCNELRQTSYTEILKSAAHHLSATSSLLREHSSHLRSEATLQKLARYLIHVQEEERKRIARDLHDDIGQRIALLKVELEMALSGNSSSGNKADAGPYKSILSQLEELSTDVQQLSHRLHSSKLRYLGLRAALKELCERMHKQQHITAYLVAAEMTNPIAADTELCFYRVAQEALHNVTKHSGADLVVVKLVETEATFQMEIQDNGRGFHYAENAEGLGLASMRERLKMVGGDLQVTSQPGCGTTLTALRPFLPAIAG